MSATRCFVFLFRCVCVFLSCKNTKTSPQLPLPMSVLTTILFNFQPPHNCLASSITLPIKVAHVAHHFVLISCIFPARVPGFVFLKNNSSFLFGLFNYYKIPPNDARPNNCPFVVRSSHRCVCPFRRRCASIPAVGHPESPQPSTRHGRPTDRGRRRQRHTANKRQHPVSRHAGAVGRGRPPSVPY